MKNKLLTLFLALAASVGTLFAQSGTCGDNLTWTLDTESGILTISGTGAMEDYYSNAPWYSYRSSITSAVISDGVTSIGNYAFEYCSSLTSIEIPNSVTSIGTYAFYGCSSLTSIVIPHGVTSIGRYAFDGCSSLTSIVIPNGVTSIGTYAFYGCSSLTSIEIPNSVTTIGNSAFSGCSSLTSITIPNSVTSIGNYAFESCSSLTSVTIPNSVTTIGNSAFSGCSSLTSVDIPNSVTSIGSSAFYGCSSLTSITIPNSVTSIGSSAFYGCSSLTSITIPNSVTSIGSTAFRGCSSLTSVDIPNSVTSIGSSAFYGCSSLTFATIGNGVTSIGEKAFYNCNSLTSITIPNSVTSIGDFAFLGCSGLPVIDNIRYADTYLVEAADIDISTYTIKEGTKWIGDWAFRGCSSLTSVDIPNSVTSIGIETFYGCSSLTSVTIGNSVTSIGESAFCECSSLTSIDIPNSVKSIGDFAFCGCSSLSTVRISSSINWINAFTFSGCSSLTSVEIPNNVTGISRSAFQECSQLTSIAIPNSVRFIGRGVFYACSNLTSITIPNSIEIFCGSAVTGCHSLTSLTFESLTPPVIVVKDNWIFYDNDLDNEKIDGLNIDWGYDDGFFPNSSCKFNIPCGTRDVYYTALNSAADEEHQISESRIIESVMHKYSVTSSDKEQGAVTITYEPTSCEDTNLSFRADAIEGYTFKQWSDGNQDNPRTIILTRDTVLTASFEEMVECGTIETTDGATVWEDELPYTWESVTFNEAGTETLTLRASDGCDSVVTFTLRVRYHNITLQENEDAQYYDLFAEDYNGQTVTTATLNRQFTQGKWATLCLPFNVNKAMMMSLGLYNRVFEFRYAQQLDDETIQMYFAPAQTLEAGKGYIVNANTKLAQKTSFVFPNVTINTDSDNGDITALTGYNDCTNRGNLFLVGTLRTGILQGSTTGNTDLGLKDNQLYYPNTTSGTSIRAYRGFFRSSEPMTAQQVRIIVDGEDSGELVIEDGELIRDADGDGRAPSVRKYIDNGILYIRRNGKTYTVQGQRID